MKTSSTGPESCFKIGNRFQIHGSIFANGGVGTTAGLDAADRAGERALTDQELGVFAGVNVVGDDGDVDTRPGRRRLRPSTSAVLPRPTGPATPMRKALLS